MVIWRANDKKSIQEDFWSSADGSASADPVNNYQTKFTISDDQVYFESYRTLTGNGGPRDYQLQMNTQINCVWAINENTYEGF